MIVVVYFKLDILNTCKVKTKDYIKRNSFILASTFIKL